jgi:hypothetical protein
MDRRMGHVKCHHLLLKCTSNQESKSQRVKKIHLLDQQEGFGDRLVHDTVVQRAALREVDRQLTIDAHVVQVGVGHRSGVLDVGLVAVFAHALDHDA